MQHPLAQLISQERQQIQYRWLEQLQRDVPNADRLEPALLQDGMPDYLDALGQMLSTDGGPWHERTHQAWAKVAREHGITRVRIGFDVSQLVHEFTVLRRVIHTLARERGVACAEDEEMLATAIEQAVETAVHAYVQARDYAARRRQAETIGFLTHELRNPLSAAMLAAGQLRRKAGAELGRPLETLERSHNRLMQLIDGVLLAEKLESGARCHKAPVELGRLLPPCFEAARALAEKKGLMFEAHFDPKLQIDVDEGLTRAALQNLADNAAKYTDEGGVNIDVEEQPGQVVVHVRDTCVGISQEELDTLFEPFRRGTTEKAGTGLGLAIARRAVEAQGGSIGVESPGRSGCHFWVALPKHAPH